MKIARIGRYGLTWFIVFLLTAPPAIMGQGSSTGASGQLKKEELAQMLAPIALYPDALLAQMLMAATYPIELVQAARFMKQKSNLSGDDLDGALKEKDWDVSVKSVCHFPKVLEMMNEKIEWTAKVGDAFLAQQDEVMDTIQELRAKAQEQGNLKTSEEQKVIVEEKIIKIEPGKADVVYVPTYNPVVVYGPWWYPAYPPYPIYYPGWYPGPVVFGFATGVVVGAAIVGWCSWGWREHHVNVYINKTVNFNKNVYIDRQRLDRSGGRWQHNPENRRGVAYRDPATSQRFGQSAARSAEARPGARGYAGQGIDRQTRESAGGREIGGAQHGQAHSDLRKGSGARENALSGFENGRAERPAGQRGEMSRGTGSFGGGARGGARGGVKMR
jgi:hypothetical protein